MIAVSDTGAGIPAKLREKVFEPFFTTKEVGKGTGLGLTMVYALLQEYGGRVEAANDPTGGAVFTLHFPAAGVADETAPAGRIAPALPDGQAGLEETA
jgi:C4-dicarboxylate-specific signal transduction histidine kinase